MHKCAPIRSVTFKSRLQQISLKTSSSTQPLGQPIQSQRAASTKPLPNLRTSRKTNANAIHAIPSPSDRRAPASSRLHLRPSHQPLLSCLKLHLQLLTLTQTQPLKYYTGYNLPCIPIHVTSMMLSLSRGEETFLVLKVALSSRCNLSHALSVRRSNPDSLVEEQVGAPLPSCYQEPLEATFFRSFRFCRRNHDLFRRYRLDCLVVEMNPAGRILPRDGHSVVSTGCRRSVVVYHYRQLGRLTCSRQLTSKEPVLDPRGCSSSCRHDF